MKEIAANQGWRLVTFLKTGCPPVATSIYLAYLKREYDECARWRDAAIKRMSEMRPTAILLGQYSERANPRREPKARQAKLSVENWRRGIRRTLEQLAPIAGSVLVLRDNPAPIVNVPNCLSRAAWHSGQTTGRCQFDKELVLSEAVRRAEMDALRALPNTSYIDLTDHHCGPEICHSVENGIIKYRDGHHLSDSYALSLTSVLERYILPAISSGNGESNGAH